MHTETSTLKKLVAAFNLAGLAIVVVGCSHQNSSTLTMPPPGTPTLHVNTGGPIANDPSANNAIVNNTIAHNPEPGKPNHLSPEMQAEIQHYQTVGGRVPNR